MSTWRKNLLIGFICIFGVSSQAQFIVEQITYEIPMNDQLVPPNKDLSNPTEKARFYLQLSENKLNDNHTETTEGIKTYASTLYMDGENFTNEGLIKDSGKVSIIYNHSKNLLHIISWDQKEIHVFSPEDTADFDKNMEAQRQEMEAQMPPEMQEMLAQMPPEMQEKAKMLMENRMDMRMPQTPKQITATGREMTQYGRTCHEYLLKDNQTLKVIWASDDNMHLFEMVKSMFGKFTKFVPEMNEGKNNGSEWVDGKIPVVVCTLKPNTLDDTKMEVRAITRITQTTPPAEKFVIPAEAAKFKQITFKELISDMDSHPTL